MSEQITTKITIKNHLTRKIIFESTKTTVREAAIEAVKEKKDLWGADLRGADLRGADLQRAYLRGADLRGANLRDAYLRDADMRNADMRNAYLRGADLHGADLQGADLQGANLQGAYLRGADLQGANLQGVYLQGVYLQGANGEKLLITSGNVLSFSGFGSAWRTTTAIITEKGIYIKCGCYEGFIKDFKAKIKTTHGNNKFAKEYLLLCKLIELRFKARLVNEAGIK